jgi:hypothetical protein
MPTVCVGGQDFFAITSIRSPQPRPQPGHFKKIDWTLFATDAGVRALDTYTTVHVNSTGIGVEKNLPESVAKSYPLMIGYSGAVVAAEFLAGRFLIRHHHAGLARIGWMIDIAYDGKCDIGNLQIH